MRLRWRPARPLRKPKARKTRWPLIEIACWGDVKAGEKIFMTRTELSCVRCHKVGNKGGEVGPKLTDIAKTKDSRYLLEAIVHPDAKIAENFETIVVLTDEDEVLTGISEKETSEKITLMTATARASTSKWNRSSSARRQVVHARRFDQAHDTSSIARSRRVPRFA